MWPQFIFKSMNLLCVFWCFWNGFRKHKNLGRGLSFCFISNTWGFISSWAFFFRVAIVTHPHPHNHLLYLYLCIWLGLSWMLFTTQPSTVTVLEMEAFDQEAPERKFEQTRSHGRHVQSCSLITAAFLPLRLSRSCWTWLLIWPAPLDCVEAPMPPWFWHKRRPLCSASSSLWYVHQLSLTFNSISILLTNPSSLPQNSTSNKYHLSGITLQANWTDMMCTLPGLFPHASFLF